MTILNMQHTLTPFLISALSKTEGEKRREERQKAREKEVGGGNRLRQRERGEFRGGGEESGVCCIDFLAVWHRP